MRDWPRLVACGFRQFCSWRSGCRPTGDRPRRNSPFRSGIIPVRCAARSDNTDALAYTDVNRRVLADLRPCLGRYFPAPSPPPVSGPIAAAGFRRACGCVLERRRVCCARSRVGGPRRREWVANTQVIDIPCRDRPDWRAFWSCGNAATETTACGSRTSPDCRSLVAVVDPSGHVLATNNWTEVPVRAQPRRLRNGGLSGLAVPVRSRRTGKRNECRSWGVEYDKQARPLT